MTRKDDKGDQPSGGETTWTNTGATRYGRGQHKTGSFGDDMLRPSPNHGTQRLPNDDETMMMMMHHLLALHCSTLKMGKKHVANTGPQQSTDELASIGLLIVPCVPYILLL